MNLKLILILVYYDHYFLETSNKINIFYINTNEIPGELSRKKLDIFTCENITLLWLHNKLCLSNQKNY